MANAKNLTEETVEAVAGEVTENTGAEGTTENPEDVAGEEEIEDSGSKELVAVYPILFLSHQYNVGDALPANYPDMVDAWLKAGTAVWKTEQASAAKAKPATAEPGLAGEAVSSESAENLAGKVPATQKRKK